MDSKWAKAKNSREIDSTGKQCEQRDKGCYFVEYPPDEEDQSASPKNVLLEKEEKDLS